MRTPVNFFLANALDVRLDFVGGDTNGEVVSGDRLRVVHVSTHVHVDLALRNRVHLHTTIAFTR